MCGSTGSRVTLTPLGSSRQLGTVRALADFDLAPHVAAHALFAAIGAGDQAGGAPCGEELALLSEGGEDGAADEQGALDGAADGLAAEAEVARRIDRDLAD